MGEASARDRRAHHDAGATIPLYPSPLSLTAPLPPRASRRSRRRARATACRATCARAHERRITRSLQLVRERVRALVVGECGELHDEPVGPRR
jgi:hypothetical protein